MTITFFGHGSMYYGEIIKKTVTETIKKHISADKKTTFLCGGYGDFDNMCANICRQLKNDQSDKNNTNQPENLNFWCFSACRPNKVNTLRRPPHQKSPKN